MIKNSNKNYLLYRTVSSCITSNTRVSSLATVLGWVKVRFPCVFLVMQAYRLALR